MSISFIRTREQLATLVLGKLGVLPGGISAASADADLVYEAIDLRLKEIHRLGIFWKNVNKAPLTFTIPSGVASASATVDILFPVIMKVSESSNDVDVDIISLREYQDILNKSDSGTPTKCYWKGSAEFLFWPVPTANTTAKLIYNSIADDTAASTAPDVEVSMMRWLKDIIAYDLGDHWGKPEATMNRWGRDAETAERKIRALAVERVDFTDVAVEQEGSYHTETDYGRY